MSNYSIIVEHPEDPSRVAWIAPAEGMLEQIVKDLDPSKPFLVVTRDDLPVQYDDYFNSWQLKDGAVTVHLEKAKVQHRQFLRNKRNEELQKLDIQFMRAMERGDMDTAQSVGREKQKLRDLTIHPAIDNATSMEELVALTYDVLINLPQ